MKSYFNFKKTLLEKVEDWKDQHFFSDVTNKEYSVKEVYDFAKKNPEFLVKDFPIKNTDALEWWGKKYDLKNKENKERMEKADTSMPVLAIRTAGSKKVSIADGLNRIKKAHDIEKKKVIPAYVINMEDIKDLGKKPSKS
jgi:hypothetical protein